jgi:secreted PhoX family phosphatase
MISSQNRNPEATNSVDGTCESDKQDVVAQFDEQRRDLLVATTAAGLAAIASMPEGAQARTQSAHKAEVQLGFTGISPSDADTVRVPAGYSANVLIAWGDPIGDLRGMPAWRPDASNDAREQALQSGTHHDGMKFFPLPQGPSASAHGLLVINHEYNNHELLFPDGSANWSLAKVRKAQAALGCSVQEVVLKRGQWQVVRPSSFARRLDANTPMRIGGPAAGSALMRTADSKHGLDARGTFANCACGWTPWGTYLTCEENFAYSFKPVSSPTAREARYQLGTVRPRLRNWGEFDQRFDLDRNRNEANHFGWVVEFDPYDPACTPVKRTALGRFSHESATVVECADGRLAIYSGDDARFEYIYRFVTARPWNKSDRSANRDLLDEGTLSVARFNPDGSGDWLELTHGRHGLTATNGFNSQAEVLCFARLAGDQVGATRMDRPEWIAHNPATGELYCALTNNTARGNPGQEGSNPSNPRAPNRFGHILAWCPEGDHTAPKFKWRIQALAGDPNHADPAVRGDLQGDLFASPDGLVVDPRGVLWVQTDLSPSSLLRGDHAIYGNNQMLAIDPSSGRARRFLTGPQGAEITGACFTPDGTTLFVNVQHPGEGGISAADPRKLSNWPDFRADGRPRSATVVVRRADGRRIGE